MYRRRRHPATSRCHGRRLDVYDGRPVRTDNDYGVHPGAQVAGSSVESEYGQEVERPALRRWKVIMGNGWSLIQVCCALDALLGGGTPELRRLHCR